MTNNVHTNVCLTAGGGPSDDCCICGADRVGSRPLVIYHKDCTDGQGAATAFYHKYRDAELHPGVYYDAPPDVQDRDVYLVDFSYPVNVLQEMLAKAHHVTIIDHHKTAIAALENVEHPRLTKFLSMDNSGAVLTWMFCYPQAPLPNLLWHIEDRDLWRFESSMTKPLTAYLYSLNFDVNEWLPMLDPSYFTRHLGVMMASGEAIMRSDEKRKCDLLANGRMIMMRGHLVPFINASVFFKSDLGNALAVGHPFACVYFDVGDVREFHLRSEQHIGVDVSQIAASYPGGGGHRHAAGFKLPISTLIKEGLL